jgi:hypothetical protein
LPRKASRPDLNWQENPLRIGNAMFLIAMNSFKARVGDQYQ